MLVMSPERCPCCGTVLTIAQETTWHHDHNMIETPYGSTIFTATKARIFDILWRARPNGVSNEVLVGKVWQGSNGGPNDAAGSVRVHCYRLRTDLAPLGIVLTAGRTGYALVITTPEEATIIAAHARKRFIRGVSR